MPQSDESRHTLRRPIPEPIVVAYLSDSVRLVGLLIANATAFLVGIRFYVETMPEVPTFLWPMYADSPTAIALATLSLVTLLPNLGNRLQAAPINTPLAVLHTLAFVWLFKYGLWAVVALSRRPSLYIGFDVAGLYDYWFIVLTHLLFVVLAFMIPYYGRTTPSALWLSLVLLITNDVLDYGFGFHPPLRYEPQLVVPAVTVGLSVTAVLVASWQFDRLHETKTQQ